MKKLKVLTVVGTRPEIIRLSCTLIALDKNEANEVDKFIQVNPAAKKGSKNIDKLTIYYLKNINL